MRRMTDREAVEQPKARHKTFTYNTALEWAGNRAGILRSEGKPAFRVSSPPEFKGEAGVWSPEDLFVASVEICHMSTFLAFALRKQLPLLAYQSNAFGTLEFIDGDYRFSRIVITPTITVAEGTSESDVHTLMREAHRHCLVANSITAVVEVNPTIITP